LKANRTTTAEMAREIFDTAWIKLEVIGDKGTLAPDVFGTVEAARILSDDGFAVFPYTTEDLIVCDRLLEAGCKVLMPWGAPIGSGRGLNNPFGLRVLRARHPDVPLIVDAGVGLPSHAAAAMELGPLRKDYRAWHLRYKVPGMWGHKPNDTAYTKVGTRFSILAS